MCYILYKLNGKNRKCYVLIVGQYRDRHIEFRYSKDRATEFYTYDEDDIQQLDREMHDIEAETGNKIYSEVK